MSEYIIEMKNITKRFPGIVANDNVTIQIKKGEIYALLGENGAGKSTLMSMLFGMYEPDEGEIYVRGKKEVITSPSYATELNIGMVHQHFKLVSNYTIAENIIMGVEPIKKFMGFLPYVDIKTSNEKIAALSKEYGLEVDPTKKIEDITVSTQQRVEILKMLYREAEILIFDEPTAVLTPQEIEFLLEIIKGLKAAGKTIILITHKLEEIKKVADRCAILNRGKLIDVLDVATTSTKEMANKMVGREVSFEREKAQAKYGEVVLSVKDLTVKADLVWSVVKHEEGVKATPGSLTAGTKSATITGLADGVTLTSVDYVKTDGTISALTKGTHYTFSNGTFKALKAAHVEAERAGCKFRLKFSDGTTLDISVAAN